MILSLAILVAFTFVGWTGANIIYMLITPPSRGDLIEAIYKRFRRQRKELPEHVPLELFPRPKPLDHFSEAVFNQWLEIKDNRTLDDFCTMETGAEKQAREDIQLRLYKSTYENKKAYLKSPGITSSIYYPGDYIPPEWRNKNSDVLDQIISELEIM